MQSNPFNLFEPFTNAQQQMMDSWSKMLFPAASAPFNPFDQFFKPAMSGVNPFMTGNPFVGGINTYRELFRVWSDIYDKRTDFTEESFKRLSNEWYGASTNFMNDYIIPMMPQEVQPVMREMMELTSAGRNVWSSLFGPWQSYFGQSSDYFVKGLLQDPEAFLEAFTDWRKTYQETISKMLNMPQLGVSREAMETQLRSLDRLIKLVFYMTEVNVKVSSLVNKNTRLVIEKCVEERDAGNIPKTFEEFYALWKENLGQNFDDFFASDEFTNLLAELIEAYMDYKTMASQVIEKQLSALPIPVKSDMDSLYKTVYDLRKEVRTLRKEVEELRSQSKKNA